MAMTTVAATSIAASKVTRKANGPASMSARSSPRAQEDDGRPVTGDGLGQRDDLPDHVRRRSDAPAMRRWCSCRRASSGACALSSGQFPSRVPSPPHRCPSRCRARGAGTLARRPRRSIRPNATARSSSLATCGRRTRTTLPGSRRRRSGCRPSASPCGPDATRPVERALNPAREAERPRAASAPSADQTVCAAAWSS